MNSIIEKLDISVLYVEDETDIREAVAETLSRRVKTLHVAINGKDGLDKFILNKPDLVITDIKMPIMDGLEMSKDIKSINKSVPIIVTTAHEEKDFFLRSIEIGIQFYLVKPIDRLKLKEALEAVAKNLELEKQVNEQKECISTLINLQNDIIIIIESKFLRMVNKAFLDYFGFENIEDFNGKYKSIVDFLQEKKEYIYKPKENGSNWLEFLLSTDQVDSKTDFLKAAFDKDHSEFVVKFEALPNSSKFIVIMKKK